MSALEPLIELARAALSAGEPAVLAHLVRVSGSHYRRPGARMILTAGGRAAGSLSGGCLERDLARRVPEVVRGAIPVAVEYDTSAPEDAVWGLGLGCNGRVSILVRPLDSATVSGLEELAARLDAGETVRLRTRFPTPSGGEEVFEEVLEPPVSLLVVGAGPDVPPLARLARELGWRVAVVAPRLARAAAERLAPVSIGGVRAPDELPALVASGFRRAVVMTHSYLDDLDLLKRLAPLPLEYLTLLGPRDRTRRLLRDLAASAARTGRLPLRSPAGLDLGAETPEEIALSVLAEIQADRRGKTARPLSELPGPIHERPSAAVVLAAGASSRMGTPKQLLRLGGETLVGRAAAQAREAGCDPVVVVLGANAERIRPAVEESPGVTVENASWREGLASSIRAGLEAVEARAPGAPGVFVLLADQPFVDAALLRQLRSAASRSGAPIAACRYGDGAGPPALFDRSLFDDLLALNGDAGARELLRDAARIAWVDFPRGAVDVDTPEDWRAVRSQLSALSQSEGAGRAQEARPIPAGT